MKTIHDDKMRQDLFSKPQGNDNHSPAVARDYENNETVLYEITSRVIKVFPNFCMLEIFLDEKGTLHVFYNRGNIIIKGRNLEELIRRLASRKIALIRVTSTTTENENSFCIDSIEFEEN